MAINSIRCLEPYDMSKAQNIVIDWDLYSSRYGFELYYTNMITRDDVCLAIMGITSLPKFKYCGDTFYVHNNKLSSLKGSPIYVGGDFHCELNKLTSWEDGPIVVNGEVRCCDNKTMIKLPKNLLVRGKFINV